MTHSDELKTSRRYRVRYQLDGARVPSEFVGTYLGWSQFYSGHQFDLRPEFGTTHLPGTAILEAREVNSQVPHSAPIKKAGS